jgi:AbrB family looped-hinge helix DNA binding protein
MAIARSRITSQGQISVPLKIREKLGIGPGSILEWEEEQGEIVVRRAGSVSSEEIHRAVFPVKPRPRTVKEMREGIRERARERHARR